MKPKGDNKSDQTNILLGPDATCYTGGVKNNIDIINEEDKENLHNLLLNINNIAENLYNLIGDETESIHDESKNKSDENSDIVKKKDV